MRFALPASTEGNCLKTAKQSSLPEWRRKGRANRTENEAGFSVGTAPKEGRGRALPYQKGQRPAQGAKPKKGAPERARL